MTIPVFLSYPKPYRAEQETFINILRGFLIDRGFEPRTLGVTDYDMDVPLKAIRRLMLDSNGLITVAFRRALIAGGQGKPGAVDAYSLDGQWLTSAWAHIEPAMAFQVGLPVLIFREQGVCDEGILEKGVLGTYMPVFDLYASTEAYFESIEFNQIMRKWEGYVMSVVDHKGNPPQLY